MNYIFFSAYNKLEVTTALLILSLAFSFFSLTVKAQNAYELKKDSFYRTFEKVDLAHNSTIFHAPIVLDKQMSTEFFYQDREKVLEPVILAINKYLDSLAFSKPFPNELPKKGMPYVFVGSSEAETAPPSTIFIKDEHDKYPPMVMHLDKASKDWRKGLNAITESTNTEYVLLIWIGLTEYPKADKGLFKKKVVLGTGYERDIRFLSAENKPVEVLQFTGVLLDRKGNIIRAGAEGFLHEDSPFWVQVLEAKTTVDDNVIKKIMDKERREDLPGNPLVWKTALNNLLERLTNLSLYDRQQSASIR